MTVERFDPPAQKGLALVNPVTDSWTAVLDDVVKLAQNIAPTEFVPAGLRGSVPKTVAAMLHGRELGLPPMTALSHTQVINGRPGTSAEVMRALILQAGHDLDIHESSSQKCTIRGRRSTWAEDRWTTVTFTIEDAAKAGLLADKVKDGKTTPSMYKRWPQAMLLARASTILARMIFADVIHGMKSVEELMEMSELDSAYLAPSGGETVEVSRRVTSATVEDGAQAAPSSAAPVAPGRAPEVGAAGSEQRPPAAPARKRAELKPRGRASAPAPEPSAPAEDDTSAEIVDAELVEDAPTLTAEVVEQAPEHAEPAHVHPLAEARAEIRERNIRNVQMHWERLLGKPVDREERLYWTRIIVGRPDVESTKDLDTEELRKLLGTLEKLRDRDQVEALVGKSGE